MMQDDTQQLSDGYEPSSPSHSIYCDKQEFGQFDGASDEREPKIYPHNIIGPVHAAGFLQTIENPNEARTYNVDKLELSTESFKPATADTASVVSDASMDLAKQKGAIRTRGFRPDTIATDYVFDFVSLEMARQYITQNPSLIAVEGAFPSSKNQVAEGSEKTKSRK